MSSNEEDPAVAWEAWLNEPDARWTCTRGELIDALTHLQASVPWPPPIQRDGTIAINAESLADAILAQMPKAPIDADSYEEGVEYERERAALLAEEHGVSYARNIPGGEFEYWSFADLIRKEPQP